MSIMKPIYSGKPEDFTWVGFGSGSGTNLRECAKVQPPAFIFSDKPAWDGKRGAKVAEEDADKLKEYGLESLIDVPRIVMDGYQACGSWQKAKDNRQESQYRERRDTFNQDILDVLKGWESKNDKKIDLIVLGGYMRLVSGALLEAYVDRIINVHPSGLPVSSGRRLYTGDNAVYDALTAGETSTRSSVILVDSGVDHGEILTQGADVRVWAECLGDERARERVLHQYVDLHQDVQKRISDWPAAIRALELIRDGRLTLGEEKEHFDEWRTVYLDGIPLCYEGLQMEGKK